MRIKKLTITRGFVVECIKFFESRRNRRLLKMQNLSTLWKCSIGFYYWFHLNVWNWIQKPVKCIPHCWTGNMKIYVYSLITFGLSRKVQRSEKINEIGRNLDEYFPRVRKHLDLDSLLEITCSDASQHFINPPFCKEFAGIVMNAWVCVSL